MRPIDADALHAKIYEDSERSYGASANTAQVLLRIETAPTLDYAPVVHGRWVPHGDDMWLCSNCKENIIFSMHESDRTEKQRYCCRCGAKMDGGAENAE